MTQELTFGVHNSELISNSEAPVVASVSIADPYVLLKMTDGSIQLLVGGTIYSCSWSLRFVFRISNVQMICPFGSTNYFTFASLYVHLLQIIPCVCQSRVENTFQATTKELNYYVN